MSRPLKRLLLHCGDEVLDSRMRFILSTRLRAVVLVAEQPGDAVTGEEFDGALIWRNATGDALNDSLMGLGMNVARISVDEEMAVILDRARIAMARKRGPKSVGVRRV